MVFSSLLFLFRFLPIILLLYYIVPKGLKNSVLFFGSLVFYGWGEPVYIGLMLFSTIVDYIHGRIVDDCRNKDNNTGAGLAVLSSVIINLSLLGFFKYSDFIIGIINQVMPLSIPKPGIGLPIGISFYTFQTMSYTIDIYRGQAKAQKNIISFGAYVAMFPQLIAGPIVQYKTIAKELFSRKETIKDTADGIHLFLAGLGKKVLLANNIGLLWDTVKGMPRDEMSVFLGWLGIFAFTFQIYFDFSGYSDMAAGLGKMFGFQFPQNFNYPYMSKSVTEFWRRWHITLGTWFREYVYIPLGGNKKGRFIQFRNIVIVWMLTGIWHGASWNFLVWGLYYGILLIIEKLFLLERLKKYPAWLSHFYTMLTVVIGWSLFAFDSLKGGFGYISILAGAGGLPFINSRSIYLLYNYMLLFLVLAAGCTSWPKTLAGRFLNKPKNQAAATGVEVCFYTALFLLSVAYLVDATYNPFLYFRF